MVKVKDVNGKMKKVSVFEVLEQKHPEPQIPPKSALLGCDSLPKFEDVEINGGHVLQVA